MCICSLIVYGRINSANAAENNKANIKIYVNDNIFELVNDTINIEGYTYISAVDAKWLFGYNCNYDEVNSKVTLSYYEDQNNNTDISVNEKRFVDLFIENANLGKAYLCNNIVYLPLRVMANRNECDIKWNTQDKSINISYNIGKLFGKEIICSVAYLDELSYIFAIYSDEADATKSVLMLEYGGNLNHQFKDINEFFESINVNYIANRKFIDLDKENYLALMNKIDNLLTDEYKGNANGYISTSRCDFACLIINKNDNYETAFESRPTIDSTVEYKELKSYLKNISGYKMEFMFWNNTNRMC